MRPTHRTAIFLLIAAFALATPVPTGAGADRPPASPPTINALLEPPEGVLIPADARQTFAWEATPGGRFRVEFSSSRDPFIPTLTSGRRTTSGDRFKPSGNQWRMIIGLATGTNPIYWRVVALGMSEAQIAAAPIASFIVAR